MKRHWVQFAAAASAAIALSLLLASCATNPEKARLKYLQKGDAYMKQKQYASAAIEYRNALKVDPRYAEAYYQLAQADLAARDAQGAYNALGQAISIDSNRLDARLARAGLLFAEAHHDPSNAGHYYDLAKQDVDYVLKQDPKNVKAYRILGSIFGAQKQYAQSLQEFTKGAALAPNDPQSYLDIALVNVASYSSDQNVNHLSDAQQDIQKAIALNPKLAIAYSDLAQVYTLEKKPELVQQTLQDGIQANPADPSAVGLYVELASFFKGQGKQSDAQKTLQDGITANPSDPSAISLYLDLAANFESQGKQSDAQNTLDSLSKQLPKSVEVAEDIGNFYVEAKMMDRALVAYQAGLSNNPQNLSLEQRIEEVYLTTGQTDSAAKLDDEMLKQAPTDVTVRVDQGRVLIAQSKYSDAVTMLQKVATDNPNEAIAHYYLAMAYEKNSDLSSANSELQQTLRVAPSSPIALTELVNLNFEQQKYSVAQLYAQELVQKVPADPRSHLLLGQVLLKLGQVKQAGDEFAAAQKLAPNEPVVLERLAALDVAEKKFPEAEQEFQTAMHAAPSNVEFLRDYVAFMFLQKQEAKATEAATQFVTQNPNDFTGHLLLGQVDMAAKNYPAALSETQKAEQLSPQTRDAYLQMGQIYVDQGNNDAAIQAYQQGLTFGPPSAPIDAMIGDVYLHKGDLSNASSQYQKALGLDPNLGVAENNLAWIYAEENQNLDVALGLAQKAKDQAPGVTSFSDTLAWVMFRKGQYAQALPLLKQCVEKAAEPAEKAQYTYHLGMVLIADGQRVEGKQKLQAALQMNLDPQDAEQARKALSQ